MKKTPSKTPSTPNKPSEAQAVEKYLKMGYPKRTAQALAKGLKK